MLKLSLPAWSGRCSRYRCNTILRPTTDGNGHTLWICEPCERNAAGLCISCDRRLVIHPKANGPVARPRRCPRCQAHATADRETARAKKRLIERRLWARAYRATPEGREATRRANRKHYHGHPRTDLDRRIFNIRDRQRRDAKRPRRAA